MTNTHLAGAEEWIWFGGIHSADHLGPGAMPAKTQNSPGLCHFKAGVCSYGGFVMLPFIYLTNK